MEFDRLIEYREEGDLALDADQKTLIIHFYPARLQSFQKRLPRIQREIAKKARQNGYQIIGVYGDDRSIMEIESNPIHLHIAQLDRPHQAPNLVFVMPGYLRDYWYVDRQGVRNHSSIRDRKFDPAQVNAKRAHDFAKELYQEYVCANDSKWPQADLQSEPVQSHSAVLILQAEKMFPFEERYIASKDLIEAVIATRGARRLYIKPHPQAPLEEQEAILAYHAPDQGVEISIASIHDLLAHADYMVTQSSAVAFEANLHKTPAIISGQTDFWHNAVVVKDADKMGDAIARALKGNFEYERYLYWFLRENYVRTNPFEPDILWQKLKDYDIPLAREVLG